MKNWERLFVQRVNELTERYSYKKQKGLMTIQLKRNKTYNESKFTTGNIQTSSLKINIVSSLLKDHVRKLSQNSILSTKEKNFTACVYDKKDILGKIQEDPEENCNNIIFNKYIKEKKDEDTLKLKEESINSKTFKIKKNINWTSHEDWLLKILSQSKLKNKWKTISKIIGTKTVSQCIYRLKKISSKMLTGNALTNIFNEVKNPNYDIENVKDMIISEYFQKTNLMGVKSKYSSSSISKESFKKKTKMLKNLEINTDLDNNNNNTELSKGKSQFLELIKMKNDDDIVEEEESKQQTSTNSLYILEKKVSISLDLINKKESENFNNKLAETEIIHNKNEKNSELLNSNNDNIDLDNFQMNCSLNKANEEDNDIFMHNKLDYSYDNINLYEFDTDFHPFNYYESEILQSKTNLFKQFGKGSNLKKKHYTEDSFKNNYSSILPFNDNDLKLTKNFKSLNEINADNLSNNLSLIKKYSGADFDSFKPKEKEKCAEYIFPDKVDIYFSDDDKFFGQKQSSGTSTEKINVEKLLEKEIDKCFFKKSPSLQDDLIEIDNIISSEEFNNLSYEDKISALNKVIMDLNVILSDPENIKSNKNLLKLQQKIIDLLISVTEYQIKITENK